MQTVLLGNPILRAVSTAVTFPLSAEVKDLCERLLEHLKEHDGVGIAAPQLAYNLRVIIVASTPNKRYPHAPNMKPTTMINPKILRASKQFESDWEGCLSVPGIRAKVPRAKEIEVSYYDKDGKEQLQSFDGFIARIVQHEIDHLDGKSFLERVDNPKTFISEVEFQKLFL